MERDDTEDEESTAVTEIAINLSILNEALSIYGSGSGGNGSTWRRRERNDADTQDDDDEVRGPLDRFFGRRATVTSLRMSYAGEGYPLRLLLAERADGPTTVCQIHTLVPERRMGLPFDDEEKWNQLIKHTQVYD
ncbi:ssDNA endodeoxyribonuclease [Serendipita sp. 399]|nr:ssDNA endodeoxyribonuclease [Serendipita sp. 399]